MFEWVGQNWWALWLALFLTFSVIEMLTLDLFFIMLGAGTLAGLVTDLAGGELWLQVLAFCIVSLLMIAFIRPAALSHLKKGPAEQRSNIDRLIGEPALVLEPVTAKGGLVKIGGDVWSARSSAGTIAAGEGVIVAAIEGATAVVTASSDPAVN